MTLKCTDKVPPAETITFVDNCMDDTVVTAIEEDGGGSVCEGKRILRKWEGPKDSCGNMADTVNQIIEVLDQEAPVLPESLEALAFTCPSDFLVDSLAIPTATDDCDESVVVTKSVSKTDDVCGNATVTWTAKDSCEKESSVNQTVRKILNFGKLKTLMLASIPHIFRALHRFISLTANRRRSLATRRKI